MVINIVLLINNYQCCYYGWIRDHQWSSICQYITVCHGFEYKHELYGVITENSFPHFESPIHELLYLKCNIQRLKETQVPIDS